LRDKFNREGFTVYEAKDGVEGLEMALGLRPHIILLDKVMPKKDGMQLLKELRTIDFWSQTVPVILLTNAGTDDEKVAKEIVNDVYTFYAVKSNLSMGDVVEQVRQKLAARLLPQ
jgi:CheY-like chemotaxis protein